jgi:hypothetical protein
LIDNWKPYKNPDLSIYFLYLDYYQLQNTLS